jgi:hypothetical protein
MPVVLGLIALLLRGSSLTYAAANEPGNDSLASTMLQLQVAARQHVEHHKINGNWVFIDHAQQRPSKLKPDFSSPKFYRLGDYYAVKYLFLETTDKPRPIVFYMVRRRPSELVVVHVDVADDKPLENLVRHKVASPISHDFSLR